MQVRGPMPRRGRPTNLSARGPTCVGEWPAQSKTREKCMNRREVMLVVGGLLGNELLRRPLRAGQPPPPEPAIAASPHAAWNDKAEGLKPVLLETRQEPLNLVRAERDASRALRYRMAP